MRADDLPPDQTKLVTPRAMKAYAEGLGWLKVEGVNGTIAAYRNPDMAYRQVVIPLDDNLDDYSERTSEAIKRLAEFESRPAQEVLAHLLLPPADVLSFREVSPESEAGDVSLEHGSRILDGARRSLMAVAHSVNDPRPFHARLRREEAKRFLSRCRMSTARGSFMLTVSCPLDLTATLPGMTPTPFARRVTLSLLDTLEAMNRATFAGKAGELADVNQTPGMSANLCEALLLMRPTGDRSHLTVSAAWSRALLLPDRPRAREVRLEQDVFNLAETLAPQLRSLPEPKTAWFFGFVNELSGRPTPDDHRPSGEVRFTLFDQEEEIHARADLSADDHAIAVRAYEVSHPVRFKGVLRRLPRMNAIVDIQHFDLLPLDEDEEAPPIG